MNLYNLNHSDAFQSQELLDFIEWLVTHSIKQMVDHVQYDICTFPMQ